MPEIHPEPPGYSTVKGFVKSNALNNEMYVAEWADDPWYPAIKNCHAAISQRVPNYNIAQIKAKFNGLRYYFDLPLEEDIDWSKVQAFITHASDKYDALLDWCMWQTNVAEAWVSGYEARRYEEKND